MSLQNLAVRSLQNPVVCTSRPIFSAESGRIMCTCKHKSARAHCRIGPQAVSQFSYQVRTDPLYAFKTVRPTLSRQCWLEIKWEQGWGRPAQRFPLPMKNMYQQVPPTGVFLRLIGIPRCTRQALLYLQKMYTARSCSYHHHQHYIVMYTF